MPKRTRRNVALLSATFLLIMQVAPALAICVCDLPPGEFCCDSPPSPQPVAEEEHGCCPERPVEPSHCAEPLLGPDEEQVSISEPCCGKDVVSTDLSFVTLPGNTDTKKAPLAVSMVVLPPSSVSATVHDRALLGYVRGPPPKTPSCPIFLLNASFLI
jgi:hypothetical protein